MQNILLYNKVSLMFLVGAMVYGVITAGRMSAVVTLLMSVSILLLVKTFHNKGEVRKTYLAGVMLTLAGMVWPYVLPFILVEIFLLAKPLEAFSFRNVMAMLLGVLTPVWIYFPYWLYIHYQAMDWVLLHDGYIQMIQLISFFDYASVTALHAITYGLLLLLFLALTIRRSSYRYKGKLFVRSQRTVYISLIWISVIGVLLIPSFAGYILPLMMAFIGPVAAQIAIGDDR